MFIYIDVNKKTHHLKVNLNISKNDKTKVVKELRALRGLFGPLWSKKLKVALCQFFLIGLLD